MIWVYANLDVNYHHRFIATGRRLDLALALDQSKIFPLPYQPNQGLRHQAIVALSLHHTRGSSENQATDLKDH